MTNDAILGVDLGGTNVRVGKVRGGTIERALSRRISGQASAEVVLGEVFEAIDSVIDDEVRGIGFGVPTVVDVEKGIVYGVENIPSWKVVPLKDELERRYGRPACINNDANAFAVGELYFGKGRGFRNLVGITLGTGLGVGVVLDGRLYSGTNCAAGELGSIPYRDSTLEGCCSGEYLRRESGMSGEVLAVRAGEGDRRALDLFASFGRALGDTILIALYAYDPEIIVLGGSVAGAYSLFEKAMSERVSAYKFGHALEKLKIVPTETPDIAVLGAAAIYLDASRQMEKS